MTCQRQQEEQSFWNGCYIIFLPRSVKFKQKVKYFNYHLNFLCHIIANELRITIDCLKWGKKNVLAASEWASNSALEHFDMGIMSAVFKLEWRVFVAEHIYLILN